MLVITPIYYFLDFLGINLKLILISTLDLGIIIYGSANLGSLVHNGNGNTLSTNFFRVLKKSFLTIAVLFILYSKIFNI
jgi:hypothetical protein